MGASLNEEKDEKLKKDWAKQGFEEFLEYFKMTLPLAYGWRFHRSAVKVYLGEGKYTGKIFQIAFNVT